MPMIGEGGRNRAFAAAILALMLLGAQLSAPPDPGTDRFEEPVYIPAGVSDSDGTIGCLVTPQGGVEAVDLATGRSRWRVSPPARALLVAGGRAFVLEEGAGPRLRLAAYAARTGKLSRAYDLAALGLPPWASLAERGEGREWTVFEVAARLAGGQLEVSYDVTRRQVSGFAGPSVVDRVQGVARVDLDSGRVDLTPGPGPAPPPLSEAMPPVPGVRFVAAHARAPGATLMLAGPPANVDGALVVGDRRLAFELSADARVVVVHRWSAPGGGREPPLRLDHGQATDAVWATIDRRHVLLRRANDQRWHDLYSLETGTAILSLERPADVAVVGPRVYWTSLGTKGELVLTATAPTSGRRLWRRIVRNPDPPPGPPIP